MEVHPMTDALYPLMKYASMGIKSGKYSREKD
jgi:hypothetical protein